MVASFRDATDGRDVAIKRMRGAQVAVAQVAFDVSYGGTNAIWTQSNVRAAASVGKAFCFAEAKGL